MPGELIPPHAAGVPDSYKPNSQVYMPFFQSEGLFAQIYTLQPGDILIQSANTERSDASELYILKKEISIGRGGALRVKFDLRADGGSSPQVWGRIYRNGLAVGTEQVTTSTSYNTYSEDVAGWSATDLVQLYVKKGVNTNFVYIRNFRIYVGAFDLTIVNTD